jgi:hypothetical protein
LNELREISSKEKDRGLKMINRLKYLYTSTERKEQLIKTAKLKYDKINEVRQKSFNDNMFFTK